MAWVVSDNFFNTDDNLKYMSVFAYSTQVRWIPDSDITSFNKIAFINEIQLD